MLSKDGDFDRDFKTAYAECTFLDLYDKVPTLDHLRYDKRLLRFVPHDDEGRSIRVVCWGNFPFRVYLNWTDADVYVFVKTGRLPQQSSVIGWLEKQQVQECAKVLVPSKFNDGAPVPVYQVDAEWLMNMPTDFNFVDRCVHFTQYGGIWDYNVEGWQCFGCGRLLADRETRESIARNTKSEQHDTGEAASEKPLS